MILKKNTTGQMSEKSRVYIYVGFSLVLSIMLFMLNMQRLPEEGTEDFFSFLSWFYGSKYSYITMAVLILALLALALVCRNLFAGYLVLELFTYILGLTNKMLYLKRNQYLQFSHFKLIREVMGLRLNILEIFSVLSVCLAVFGIVLAVWIYQINKKLAALGRAGKKLKATRILCGVFLVALIGVTSYICAARDYFDTFYGILKPQEMGSLMWFLESGFTFEEEVVTQELSDELYQKYKDMQGGTDGESATPNIIVIMSESFWDTNHLKGMLEFSEDPLERFRILQKKYISGQAAVNVYGGGTITSEMEFLTGINSYFSADFASFYRREKQECFVSYLKEQGYYTMAFHPYEASSWNRNEIYAGMGFDKFYDMTEFKNVEYYRGYISDSALSKEIIDRFEEHKQDNNPVFCFAVSVQNHRVVLKNAMTDAEDKFQEDIQITYPYGKTDAETEREISEYVNGISASVNALYELINFFSDYDENTVIVFFGDHAPDLPNALTSYYGLDEIKDNYRTPYLIWSNFEMSNEEYGNINCSYLSSVLMDAAGMKKTNQYYANMYMAKRYPISTFKEIVAKDGTDIKTTLKNNSESDLVREYQADVADIKKLVTITRWKMQQGSMLTDFWK